MIISNIIRLLNGIVTLAGDQVLGLYISDLRLWNREVENRNAELTAIIKKLKNEIRAHEAAEKAFQDLSNTVRIFSIRVF